MKTITNDVYTYIVSSTEEEIELTKSVIKDSDFSDKKELSEKVLDLPFNEQLHVIHCILDTMYLLSPNAAKIQNNKKVESFLALKVFNIHRKIIMDCVDFFDDPDSIDKISEYENKFNIKIICPKE